MMNDKYLFNNLKGCLEEKDWYSSIEVAQGFPRRIQSILLEFKDTGGQKQNAEKVVKELILTYADNITLQDLSYDIYDIVTGWCKPGFIVWKKEIQLKIDDDLVFKDDEDRVVFNHYSFCEIVKHIMVKYGNITYKQANEKVINSWLIKVPNSYREIQYITCELDYHWAMDLAYGHNYWTKGIPSDYNDFNHEYQVWKVAIMQKYNLKKSYRYDEI
ncbi:MAG: hypothetical protein ACI94Y_001276 [Maribacter sp.]|jgi:hypothetical protein